MTAEASIMDIDGEDRLRADLYNFLGLLLARPAGEMLLEQTAALTGDDSPIGQAIAGLANSMRFSSGSGAVSCCPMPAIT